MKNNYYLKRFIALSIDLLIVTILVSLLSQIKFLNPYLKEYNQAISKYSEYVSMYTNSNISTINNVKYINLYHDVQKYSISLYIIYFVVFVLYYTLFPYFNKNQTIGKKLLKLKYKSNNNDNISIWNYFLRSLITPVISSIIINVPISYLLYILIVLLFKGKAYFYIIEVVSLLICAYGYIDIIYFISKKQKITLHDKITKINVVEC